MYYIIGDQYSAINEKNNIAFYNMTSKQIIDIFSIKGSTEYNIAELLNNPIDTLSLDKVWSRYWDMITKNSSMMKYFSQIDEPTYFVKKDKYDCINEFISLNKEAYKMEKWAFFTAVKHVVFNSEITYVGESNIKKYFDGLNFNTTPKIDISYLKENNLYIINLNEVDMSNIAIFEQMAVKNNIARLYMCEDFKHIWIGPALYGNQFGCLMCNDFIKNKAQLPKTMSDLLISLLKTEVIKLFPELIECMMQDNTLSKGKIFTLNKFDMSANQNEFAVNVNCKVCAN